MSGDEREAIRAALEELRLTRAGDDREAIRDKTTALNHATEHLADVLMDAALKGALGSKRAAEIMAGEDQRGQAASAPETS